MISLLEISGSKKYNLFQSKTQALSVYYRVLTSRKISFNRIKYKSMRERNSNR